MLHGRKGPDCTRSAQVTAAGLFHSPMTLVHMPAVDGSSRDFFLRGEIAMTAGTIKTLVRDRGFGFIRSVEGLDYFFHSSACICFEALVPGDHVEFIGEDSPKGPRAVEVKLLTAVRSV